MTAFSTSDAGRFFGRERETEAFANRLRAQALLAVVGPSGAGKSSFVQAGVIPALAEDWRVITVRPGSSPLINLCARLAVIVDPKVLHAELLADPASLGNRLRARETAGMTMIVVDQFEELFTLCEDVSERELFAEALVRAARSPDESVRVVITMRDDFLLHAEGLGPLRSRLAPALHLLTSPSPTELRRIVVEPLRQVGYELDDPKLADEIVESLAATRSPLALLSFTCSKLWELRDRRFRQLARKAYTSLGGVGGALAQHAERTLAAMRPEEQRLVREVFRHAVTADGTRAVLARGELDEMLGDSTVAKNVLEKLIAARLLVSSDSATGGEEIEITHEALILAWPRLVTWRREDAEGARLRDQLRAAAKQWEERGRPTGLLWRGDALAEYRLWRARYPGALATADEAFANASLTDAARTQRRRRIVMASAFAVLSIGVVLLVVLSARATASATRLSAALGASYEDQGRRYVLDGQPLFALPYLDEARKLGVQSVWHDMMVAFGTRAISSKEFELEGTQLVSDAAFSPDTKLVAIADGTNVIVWNSASGQRAFELPPRLAVIQVVFSPDGKFLATVVVDSSVVLWDVATRKEMVTLKTNRSLVRHVVFSPDSKLAATVGHDDVVELWDVTSGALLATLQATEHASEELVTGDVLMFSPDGTKLIAGDTLGVIRVWDVATRALVASNTDHTKQINDLEPSRDGTRLVAASNDGTASIVDLATGKRLLVVRHRLRVNAAAFSPNGRFIATGANDRVVGLWDASTGEAVRTLLGHRGGINTIAFRPDGSELASGGDDRTIIVWDVATGRREAHLIGHASAIYVLRYNSTGTKLISAAQDLYALQWAPRPQIVAHRIEGHTRRVVSAEFSPDGQRVLTASEDGAVRVWDRKTYAKVLEIQHPAALRVAAYSPDGRLIAFGDIDGKVQVHDAATGTLVRALPIHTERINGLAWLPDSKRVATVSNDGVGAVSPIDGGAPVKFMGHGSAIKTVSVSADAIVTAAYDTTLFLWDPVTGKERARWSDLGMMSAELDPAGTTILGNNFAGACTWKLTETKCGIALLDTGDMLSARWSRDGQFIVTASVDATTRIWSPSGKLLAVLEHDDYVPVYTAAFAPDASAVVSGDQNGAFTIWDLPEHVSDLPGVVKCVGYGVEKGGLVRTKVDASCAGGGNR